MRFVEIRKLQKELRERYGQSPGRKQVDITGEFPKPPPSGSRFGQDLEEMMNTEYKPEIRHLLKELVQKGK